MTGLQDNKDNLKEKIIRPLSQTIYFNKLYLNKHCIGERNREWKWEKKKKEKTTKWLNDKGTCLNLTLGSKLKGDWLQHINIYLFSPVCQILYDSHLSQSSSTAISSILDRKLYRDRLRNLPKITVRERKLLI